MQNDIWLKRVLVPFWVVEFAWLGLFLVVDVIVLSSHIISIIESVRVAMCAISIILNITAIVLFSRHKLTPVIYLVFQCIKAAFWTAIAVLIILASLEYYLSIATVVLMVVFLGTSFGQLIYGSVIFHCHRKGKLSRRGRYAGVEDGPELANDDLPPRGSYAAYNPHNIAPLQPSSLANREPAPDYSGTSALQHPTTMHPAMRPIGAPAEYYDASAAQPLYELQGTAYGDR